MREDLIGGGQDLIENAAGNGMPKRPIGPAGHAVIDYTTAATWLGLAATCRNPRARSMAIANGLGIIGLSMFTDYAGGVFRKLSFRTHGMIDTMTAVLTAGAPMMLGFSRERDAKTFYAMAGLEGGAIAATECR